MPYQIYLDVCCLNRPFDDWIQPRVRLEAEAVLAIIEKCESSDWHLISSTVLEIEIERTPDPVKRQRVLDSLTIATRRIMVTEPILSRSRVFQEIGIRSFDALHLACAESAEADVLLTTDDRLLRKAIAHQSNIGIRVANPVSWFMEAIKPEEER